jgi:hypothetical protein
MSDEKHKEPIETKPEPVDTTVVPKKTEKDDPIHSGPPGTPLS